MTIQQFISTYTFFKIYTITIYKLIYYITTYYLKNMKFINFCLFLITKIFNQWEVLRYIQLSANTNEIYKNHIFNEKKFIRNILTK